MHGPSSPPDGASRLVVITAGTSDPSSSRLLAGRAAARVAALAAARGHAVTTTVIELRDIATEVTTALTTQFTGPRLRAAIDALAAADGVVAATPVYKAAPSGLFTSFFDVLDNDLLIGTPVVLAATAGTQRHALVVDDQLRPLFAYLRALPVPTSLFAAPEDWGDTALAARVDRAATELLLLMESGFARAVRDESWDRYQHEFGSAATKNSAATRGSAATKDSAATDPEGEIELDSDLMRLATGGSAT
jgi:FMN reductase